MAINAEQLLYRSPGGIGRYTGQLLEHLPGLRPDIDVVPFTARHSRRDVDAALDAAGTPRAVRQRIAIQALPRPLLYESWVRLARPRLRGVGPLDVVHAPSVAVPPRGSTPLVVSVHDAAPVLFPEAFPRRGLLFHLRGLDAAARRADVVITGTEAAAAEIVRHTRIGADRIRVVPYALSDRAAGPLPGPSPHLAWMANRRFVLWVGTLEPRKGVATLVAAMAAVRRRPGLGDVLTVLAGYDGWLGDELVPGADRDALGDLLVQTGRVSEADLWHLYRHAALFAFPSRHEGFGLPVVEAMSQGVAVVASDLAPLREVSAGAALLVEPGNVAAWADAIAGILGDDRRRAAMGRAGRARSAYFSPAALVARTAAVYASVV